MNRSSLHSCTGDDVVHVVCLCVFVPSKGGEGGGSGGGVINQIDRIDRDPDRR